MTGIERPVLTDPHCRCRAAIVGTVKDGIRHDMKRCAPIGCQDYDWRAIELFMRKLGLEQDRCPICGALTELAKDER
jgi:hypothetical protein